MNIKVHAHLMEIVKSPINEKELNITKCNFEFDEGIEGVKKAYFTLDNGNTYMQYITNNECDIPNEVLANKGELTIGVSVETIENDETIKRYNPSPVRIATWEGSLKDYKNSETPTPSDLEQIEQMVSNINIDGQKEGRITTITITYKDGTSKQLTLEDGKSIEYNWQGTQLGIRQEGESTYQYVNLKGDKGDAGAIKVLKVNELPTEDIKDDTIYLVPMPVIQVETLPTTGQMYTIYVVTSTQKRYRYVSGQWVETLSNDNNLEYMYIDNAWELVGQADIEIDLTDYVKNTDYASSSKGGVVKLNGSVYGLAVDGNGFLSPQIIDYATYLNKTNYYNVSKGVLENVITGKGLINNQVNNLANYYTKTEIDNTIGDINSALDLLNGEVI